MNEIETEIGPYLEKENKKERRRERESDVKNLQRLNLSPSILTIWERERIFLSETTKSRSIERNGTEQLFVTIYDAMDGWMDGGLR